MKRGQLKSCKFSSQIFKFCKQMHNNPIKFIKNEYSVIKISLGFLGLKRHVG